MSPHETETKLRNALSAAKFDADDASPVAAWKAVKESCADGLNKEGDGVLVEWGTYTRFLEPGRPAYFILTFVRQFTQRDEDEFLQLHLELSRTPDSTTDALGKGNVWSFGARTFTEFVDKVVAIPQIADAMKLKGYRARVWIDQT